MRFRRLFVGKKPISFAPDALTIDTLSQASSESTALTTYPLGIAAMTVLPTPGLLKMWKGPFVTTKYWGHLLPIEGAGAAWLADGGLLCAPGGGSDGDGKGVGAMPTSAGCSKSSAGVFVSPADSLTASTAGSSGSSSSTSSAPGQSASPVLASIGPLRFFERIQNSWTSGGFPRLVPPWGGGLSMPGTKPTLIHSSFSSTALSTTPGGS
mmetsp:Transcript_22432/g.65213  ORF Transcript_22432/g.65213 Transcript_22432/m.65213 type:complete len:210 (-) Transcript_22432:1736-2365(-)